MAKAANKFVLVGGKVLDPASKLDGAFDILVQDGVIQGVEKPGAFASLKDAEKIDVSGLLVVPGLIDIHVHLREPGQEWKETIATGTQAAAAGGFTGVCCMPNTKPAIDTAQVVKFILEQAEAAGYSRVYPIGAITVGREGKALAPMLELKEAGCVAFSDDGAPVSDAGVMRKALEYSLMLDTVLAVHEEDLSLSDGCAMNESALSLKMGLKGMPGAAEDVMIARDIELARLTGARVHFCHVSTARGVELIRRAKADGIPVTAEATPHNITLTEKAVEGYNTLAKMSMPLRGQADVDGVFAGVLDGTLDCIASDHAPHEADSKNREFQDASFGIIGFQTTLPLILAKVRAGKMTLSRAIESLTSAPARCFKLTPTAIRKGAVADITVIDLEKKMLFTPEVVLSKSKNSPFFGTEMQGLAVRTFVGGREVYSAFGKGEN